MKSTSAAEVIIQALWPGPDVVASVGAFGWLLVTYASTSARRAVSSALRQRRSRAGAAGAAAGLRRGAAAAGAAAGGSSADEGRVVITNIAAEKARKSAMRGMVFVMSKSFWFGE